MMEQNQNLQEQLLQSSKRYITHGPDRIIDNQIRFSSMDYVSNNSTKYKIVNFLRKKRGVFYLLLVILLNMLLDYISYVTSRNGIEDENAYTENHYNFNTNYFQIFWKSLALFFILSQTKMNFGVRCCHVFFDVLLLIILTGVRIFAIYYTLNEVSPKAISTVRDSFMLFETNYWASDDEPFKTNASYINAGICWVITIFVLIISVFYLWVFLIFTIRVCSGCKIFSKLSNNLKRCRSKNFEVTGKFFF